MPTNFLNVVLLNLSFLTAAVAKDEPTYYTPERIAIAWNQQPPAELGPEMPIRIYNRARSAVYHIGAIERQDDELWLTRDATALFARGRAIDFAEGQITLDVFLTYADGTHPHNSFDGTYVSDEQSVEHVRGATHDDHTNIIYLGNHIGAVALKQRLNNRVVSVWQYGMGDNVAVARVLASR